MHNLDAVSLAAVCVAFQAVSRDALPVGLAAAGLPDLQARLMRAKPDADRLFEYRELGRLRDAGRGQVDFTVPLFAEFLIEHHPVDGFRDE